jgi:hypothetical protein
VPRPRVPLGPRQALLGLRSWRPPESSRHAGIPLPDLRITPRRSVESGVRRRRYETSSHLGDWNRMALHTSRSPPLTWIGWISGAKGGPLEFVPPMPAAFLDSRSPHAGWPVSGVCTYAKACPENARTRSWRTRRRRDGSSRRRSRPRTGSCIPRRTLCRHPPTAPGSSTPWRRPRPGILESRSWPPPLKKRTGSLPAGRGPRLVSHRSASDHRKLPGGSPGAEAPGRHAG